MEQEAQEEQEVCRKCKGSPAAEPHTCPYAEDICGDYVKLCNCCYWCKNQCVQDI